MRRLPVLVLALAILVPACGGGAEATRVQLPVVVDGAGLLPVTNDLGWTVTLTAARVAVTDVQFTIEGEAHSSLGARVWAWLVPSAHAHPGHHAGGDVTGELPGRFVLDFFDDGAALGPATLLEGRYQGANLTFRAAGAEDGLVADDPLLGHVAHLAGSASKGGRTIGFTASLDLDEGTQVVGLPFALEVRAGASATVGLGLLTQDPFEPDTLFDGLDFGALADADSAADDAVAVLPGTPAHNLLRRTLQLHDQWSTSVR